MERSVKYRLCSPVDNDSSRLRIVGDGHFNVSYPEADNSSFGPHVTLDCSGALGRIVLMVDLADLKRVAREVLGIEYAYKDNIVPLKLICSDGGLLKKGS